MLTREWLKPCLWTGDRPVAPAILLSFLPQRLRRIDGCGVQCWDEGRNQSQENQQRCDCGQRLWIAGADTEQQAFYVAARCERRNKAQTDAQPRAPQALEQHLADQEFWRGAQRGVDSPVRACGANTLSESRAERPSAASRMAVPPKTASMAMI